MIASTRLASTTPTTRRTSLVLKRFGWLEEAFKADGTAVRWVLSQGSNRALEYLAAGGVDFGSTAGLATCSPTVARPVVPTW